MEEYGFAVPNMFGVEGEIMWEFYRKIDEPTLKEICTYWDLTRKSKPCSILKIRVPKNHSNKNFFYPNKPKGTVVFVKKEQVELVIYFSFFVKEIDKKTLNDFLDYTKTIIMVKPSRCQDLRHKLKSIPRQQSPRERSQKRSRERSPQYSQKRHRERERSPQYSQKRHREREQSPQYSKNYRSGWYIDRNPKKLDERDKLIHELYSKLYHVNH